MDIVRTRTHWSKKFLFGNRSVNIPALGLRLDWFEISVSRFLSDKKANGYKPDCSFILRQFQVVLSNREGFLDLGDIHYSKLIAKPSISVEISCKVSIIVLTLCFYCSFSVYSERMFAFRRSNFVALKAVRMNSTSVLIIS